MTERFRARPQARRPRDGTDPRHQRFERGVDRLEGRLPARWARRLHRLRAPSARWLRLPVGGLLVVGGLFSILPFLGIWMLPLGILLLAYDVPFLKPPAGWALVRGEHLWRKWKRRRNVRAAPDRLRQGRDR